jgi:hypothetical protein
MNVLTERGLVPIWSPNGKLLAYQGRFGIVVARTVRPARPRFVGDGVIDCCELLGISPPSWTRDSRRLVFAQVQAQ